MTGRASGPIASGGPIASREDGDCAHGWGCEARDERADDHREFRHGSLGVWGAGFLSFLASPRPDMDTPLDGIPASAVRSGGMGLKRPGWATMRPRWATLPRIVPAYASDCPLARWLLARRLLARRGRTSL